MFVSSLNMDFNKFKEICTDAGIQMTSFESVMEFSEFKLERAGTDPGHCAGL